MLTIFSITTSRVLKAVKPVLTFQFAKVLKTATVNFDVAAQSKPATGKAPSVDRIVLSNLPTSTVLKLQNRPKTFLLLEQARK